MRASSLALFVWSLVLALGGPASAFAAPAPLRAASAALDDYFDIRGGQRYRCTPDVPTPPGTGTQCNYTYSDSTCERAQIGSSCTKDGQRGACTPSGWTNGEGDCKCALGTGSFPDPTAGTKCNYTYSDSVCERAVVGASCLKDGVRGSCTPEAWTRGEGDCKCLTGGSAPSPDPVSGTKCNYTYSDSACERSSVGALCLKDGSRGNCSIKGWTGSEADCACAL